MRHQPKRFVVELKRGTNRAAFASPDPTADRFSSAETALFGRAPDVEPRPEPPKTEASAPLAGRILRSLVEPPPPVAEDPPPVRRGRKPGSKNKPKPEAAGGIDLLAERPRRGRKPGSKNKPKTFAGAEAALPRPPGGMVDTAALMRSYGFADDAPAGVVTSAEAAPQPAPERPAGGRAVRARLRDRSAILRRYVLELDPGPGQPGALRARRRGRAAAR